MIQSLVSKRLIQTFIIEGFALVFLVLFSYCGYQSSPVLERLIYLTRLRMFAPTFDVWAKEFPLQAYQAKLFIENPTLMKVIYLAFPSMAFWGPSLIWKSVRSTQETESNYIETTATRYWPPINFFTIFKTTGLVFFTSCALMVSGDFYFKDSSNHWTTGFQSLEQAPWSHIIERFLIFLAIYLGISSIRLFSNWIYYYFEESLEKAPIFSSIYHISLCKRGVYNSLWGILLVSIAFYRGYDLIKAWYSSPVNNYGPAVSSIQDPDGLSPQNLQDLHYKAKDLVHYGMFQHTFLGWLILISSPLFISSYGSMILVYLWLTDSPSNTIAGFFDVTHNALYVMLYKSLVVIYDYYFHKSFSMGVYGIAILLGLFVLLIKILQILTRGILLPLRTTFYFSRRTIVEDEHTFSFVYYLNLKLYELFHRLGIWTTPETSQEIFMRSQPEITRVYKHKPQNLKHLSWHNFIISNIYYYLYCVLRALGIVLRYSLYVSLYYCIATKFYYVNPDPYIAVVDPNYIDHPQLMTLDHSSNSSSSSMDMGYD
jgi:hypothetical protein